MAISTDVSLKVKSFKCFGSEPQGFDVIKPINLIIGRNNSGKSALLDILMYATTQNPKPERKHWHNNCTPELHLSIKLCEDHIRQALSNVSPYNYLNFGHKLEGAKLSYDLCLVESGFKTQPEKIKVSASPNGQEPLSQVSLNQNNDYKRRLVSVAKNPFSGKTFKRLGAERNIDPEPSTSSLCIDVYGRGATNLIQTIINSTRYDTDLVKRVLLEELNKIFVEEGEFLEISCQIDDGNNWEIYLREETKGVIALSQSGSSLKTIILVLSFLFLLPKVENKDRSNYIFAFEELENNLHPALLRRLLAYLADIASKKAGPTIFLTTHSNVAIDIFTKNENAQLLHVTHNRQVALCKVVKTYGERRGVLDDIDVRASDLLQSNGIIWVEGPTDRMYLSRWIELWSNGELREGEHYSCVFYGGRLLSHLSASDNDEVVGAVEILKVNRNCAILIDSDKKNNRDVINDTKKRLVSEIESIKGVAWVTKGREIENYLSSSLLKNIVGSDQPELPKVKQFESFFNKYVPAHSLRYTAEKKIRLASDLVPYMTKENIKDVLDLNDMLDKICSEVRKWNGFNKPVD